MSPRKVSSIRKGLEVCIIPADITVSLQRRKWPAEAAEDPYRYVRNALDGWPEIVHCGDDGGSWDDVMMFVDEDGKLKKDKRFNLRASILHGFFRHGDFIVGDAVLIGKGAGDEIRNIKGPRVTSLEPYFASVIELELIHYIQGVITSGSWTR